MCVQAAIASALLLIGIELNRAAHTFYKWKRIPMAKALSTYT